VVRPPDSKFFQLLPYSFTHSLIAESFIHMAAVVPTPIPTPTPVVPAALPTWFNFASAGTGGCIAWCMVHPFNTAAIQVPLTHSLIHTATHPLIQALTHSYRHSLTHTGTHSLILSYTHTLTHACSHLLTYAHIHSRTYSLTHSPRHTLTHLSTTP
jgi:hypothetical protein